MGVPTGTGSEQPRASSGGSTRHPHESPHPASPSQSAIHPWGVWAKTPPGREAFLPGAGGDRFLGLFVSAATVWRLVKLVFRLFWKLPASVKLVAVVCAPLALLNGAVAFFGSSVVFPLSPSFLKEKVHALRTYAAHRPRCLLSGHDDLGPLADRAEKRHGLPRGLMRAIVQVESGGRAHRISFAGAMGPAQLMPGTARLLGVKDPFDPAEAVDAGARYLAQQLTRMNGRVDLAVAAYNAGPNAVQGRVPRNGETELYVAKVLRQFKGVD